MDVRTTDNLTRQKQMSFSWMKEQHAYCPWYNIEIGGCLKLRVPLLWSGVPNLWDLMPDDLRWSWCNSNRNKVHDKCDVLESSWDLLLHSHSWKNCLHETSPWCQKDWGPLQPTDCAGTPHPLYVACGTGVWRDPPAAAAAVSHEWGQAHLSACKWGKTADLSQFLTGRSEIATTVQMLASEEGY